MGEYRQDEAGQWWYYAKRGNRQRVTPQTCLQCGAEFISRHPQRLCSAACRAAAQKGVLRAARVPRSCEQCGKTFTPRLASKPSKTCSRRCAYDLGNTKRGRAGELNPRWKGGTKNHKAGYKLRYAGPKRKMVLEHRLVMEGVLGRPLERFEEVHHKNGQRADNRPENLELWIKRQPGGQRATDLIEFARWVLERYEPLALQGKLL